MLWSWAHVAVRREPNVLVVADPRRDVGGGLTWRVCSVLGHADAERLVEVHLRSRLPIELRDRHPRAPGVRLPAHVVNEELQRARDLDNEVRCDNGVRASA